MLNAELELETLEHDLAVARKRVRETERAMMEMRWTGTVHDWMALMYRRHKRVCDLEAERAVLLAELEAA